MSESTTRADDTDELVTQLREAAEAYEAACERVEAAGEDRLQRLQDSYDELTSLMNRYEDRIISDGDGDVDMEAFIEYQDELAHFVNNLPEDLSHRERFEEVDEIMHQKWLKSGDFETARDAIEPVGDLVARLEERERTHQEYVDARKAIEARLRSLDEQIDDRKRLVELGDADLDAPVEHLRDPIETYNERVTDAFETFKHDAPARDVLAFVQSTDSLPLVEYRQPPKDLQSYIERNDVGSEPIRTILDYAEYSKSKLDHYVEDAGALKRNVATHQTYLRSLDGGPLTVSWPPPEASELRWRCKELIPAVDRLVGDDTETLDALRTVRALADRDDYDRLRDSAMARTQLAEDERDRLKRGVVQQNLEQYRDQRERLEDALDEYEQ